MSFTSDQKLLRTIDSEHALELKERSGGSDGTISFQLFSTVKSQKPLTGFLAKLESRSVTTEESKENKDIEEISTWTVMSPDESGLIIPGYTFDQSIVIIKEALSSYKWVHGIGSEKTKFLVKMSKYIKN